MKRGKGSVFHVDHPDGADRKYSPRELADAIIGEENSILRQLTEEDLELLLS